MADQYNPIYSVGTSTNIPTPSKFEYKLSDVSAADAGRTEDGKMHKMRIAQKVHLELEWQYVTTAQASTILTAFNPEYISVKYLDPKAADFVTKTFYVGDRSAPAYNTKLGLWENVSFNIIEQ
jgi:hypothetical protein